MSTTLRNGVEYEIYTKNIILNKYLNCWLWKEVPNQILIDLGFNENSDDIGCDIVCQNHDLSYILFNVKIILLQEQIILLILMIYLDFIIL